MDKRFVHEIFRDLSDFAEKFAGNWYEVEKVKIIRKCSVLLQLSFMEESDINFHMRSVNQLFIDRRSGTGKVEIHQTNCSSISERTAETILTDSLHEVELSHL